MSKHATSTNLAGEAAPARRSWLKRLGVALGGALLAGPALARTARSPLQVQETEPFLGEIMLCVYGFTPKGFLPCDGQTLPINTNQALFALLGTTYGGNGIQTFNLPDLRGRVPRGTGPGYTLGQQGGTENTTLTAANLPAHTHGAQASSAVASVASPIGAVPAVPTAANLDGEAVAVLAYGAAAGSPATTTAATGGGQPFANQSPYQTIQYCIAVQGLFPARG